MYRNVLTNLRDNQNVWESIPVFVTGVDTLSNKFVALNEAINQQKLASVRVTNYRDERLKEIRTGIKRMIFVLYQFGIQTGDPVMMGTYKVAKSDIERMSLENLNFFIVQLKHDLEAHGSELSAYGVTASEVNSILASFNDVSTIISMVRQRINERKFRTSEVDRIDREINTLLNSTLDGFMFRFSDSHPEFYSTYRMARIVVEQRGPSIPPREPDDGSLAS